VRTRLLEREQNEAIEVAARNEGRSLCFCGHQNRSRERSNEF
jgi:hypothetical protein